MPETECFWHFYGQWKQLLNLELVSNVMTGVVVEGLDASEWQSVSLMNFSAGDPP